LENWKLSQYAYEEGHRISWKKCQSSAGVIQHHMEEVQGIGPHDLCNGTDKPTQFGNVAHVDHPDQQGGQQTTRKFSLTSQHESVEL
jgi:hypothetical protein